MTVFPLSQPAFQNDELIPQRLLAVRAYRSSYFLARRHHPKPHQAFLEQMAQDTRQADLTLSEAGSVRSMAANISRPAATFPKEELNGYWNILCTHEVYDLIMIWMLAEQSSRSTPPIASAEIFPGMSAGASWAITCPSSGGQSPGWKER